MEFQHRPCDDAEGADTAIYYPAHGCLFRTAESDRAWIASARPNPADFIGIDAQTLGAEGEAQFTAPEDPGTRELRLLVMASQAVLGRTIGELQ